MRQADLEPPQFDRLCPLRAAAIEEYERLASPVRQHFDVLPAHPPDTGPQRLHHRFFRCKPRREFGDSSPAMRNLVGSVDALEETVPVTPDDIFDPVDLDDVDAYCKLRCHGMPC